MSHDTGQRASPVTIAQSELHRLDSQVVGQRYQVRVRLPEDYSDGNDVYPVLYLLDGDHMFAMATDIVQYLVYGGNVPDLIIVSPAYGSKRTPDVGGTNMRNRDLLPFPVEGVPDQSAGARDYLAFLERELMPFVASRYRVDGTQRLLAGYSLGALFVVYALFEKPGLFDVYLAWDSFAEQLWAHEDAFARSGVAPSVRVCLASRADPDADLAPLAERLAGRGLPGLSVSHTRLAGGEEDHFLVPGEALTRCLIAAFHPSGAADAP